MSKLSFLPILLCALLFLLGPLGLCGQGTTTADSSLAASFRAVAQQHDVLRGNPAAQTALHQEFAGLYNRFAEIRKAGGKPSLRLYEEAIATARTLGLVHNALTLLQLQAIDHPLHSTECHCGKCHQD